MRRTKEESKHDAIALEDKTDEDSVMSLAVLKDYDDDRFSSNLRLNDSKTRMLTSAKIEQHTKLFASMCPDEILDHFYDYSTREYHTTLMLGDVSGFTDLTEKYTKMGRGGPSKLTEILNTYIGAMVQEILSRNGDVLKFSGDAFIVMWKVEEGMVMRDVAVEVIQTACTIQKYFGSYDSDVGITLKVKLAIASGKTYFTSIGDPAKMSYYIITGKPVWDVKAAECLCRGGDIIVAPSSWQWANPNEFIFETLPDGEHTLILASSIMWEPAKERYQKKDIMDPDDEDYANEQRNLSLFASFATDRVPEMEAAPVLMNLTGDTLDDYQSRQVDYTLRPKVNKVAKAHMKNALRSYMLRPVVRSVEMDEPIEYLTEMRQIVILFINVITINVGKRKLIRMVNMAYKLVCGIVDSMQGCTNKTSLFDKDLMFLCIFGLRGDKHELESQIGLRCAAKTREALAAIKNIKSVTIGVTTGMTYCGVVGHILRREYTVIGMSVNKAARLMCAYPDKVVCDRDTFLHSRLEARHFILQEPKQLKGITNIGPVYQFLEQTSFLGQDYTLVNKFPLLGRDKEIATFVKMLHTLIHVNNHKSEEAVNIQNTLIIRGEPRMGKTRLLDELVQNIPNNIPCNRICLLANDNKSPYTLIHLIFSIPLGFTTTSTPKEREDKLINLLGKVHFPSMLCSLNQVFNVNFTISQKYNTMFDSEKQEVMEKLLWKLVLNSFSRLWVIVVDDAEYSDEESLSLLPTMVRQDMLLFVLAFGQKLAPDPPLLQDIMKRAKITELAGVDKWFHAGLACQILDVGAIPAELEKVIQQRSLGNPGWIESYLVSLVQAGGLIVMNIQKGQLRNLGLVSPPVEMLRRSVVGLRVGNLETDDMKRMDGWKMYQSSYRDSVINVQEKLRMDHVPVEKDDEQEIAVCTIAPDFVLEDVDTEITMDVMILKMFDSLSSLDQLLLKCAAVLGETFNRNMLESLLDGTSARDIGLAVKRLFEIRILGCAMGDFKTSPGPIVFLRKIRNPNIDMEIRCVCTGIVIAEACADLPNYASCGLMRFRMPMFRDTTYRLLIENQKVEFHDKALKYLQQKTRRCVSCGGGHFVKLLGQTYDEAEAKKEKRTHDNFNFLMNLAEYGENTDSYEVIGPGPGSDTTPKKACVNVFRPVQKSSTRTFSNVDFADCQCNLILVSMYTQVLAHCRGVRRKDKTLTAIIEFVEVCLAACNIPQARKLLNDGEVILSQMTGLTDDEILIPFLSGKIKTLQGRCYLESGLIMEAKECLYQAIKTLGYNFPTWRITAKIKSVLLLENQKLMLRCLRTCRVGVVHGYAADYSDQLANCLAQMFTMFKARGLEEHYHLAAIWGLNAALESNQDFFALCTAYGNMMVTAHNFGHKSIITALENDAINVCARKKDNLELQELKAVAELYSTIFYSRMLSGEIVSATSIAFTTIRICQTIHFVTLKLTMLPMLIYVLMLECRFGEVVSMLQELEFTSKVDMDKSGTTWYYALCVDLQLETGLTVIPFRKCEQYYQEEGDLMITLQDPEAERRYYTCMWLWCIRSNDWEAATVWKSKIATDPVDSRTFAGVLTVMKRLEGHLIYYVHKMDNRNAKAIAATLPEIHIQFKWLSKMRHTGYVGMARFYLLKAYYHMIRFHTRIAMRLLQESKKTSLKQHKKLLYEWADHCEKVWTGSISSIQRDFWKDHCTLDTVLDWHEVEMNAFKIVPYSLPLPKFPH